MNSFLLPPRSIATTVELVDSIFTWSELLPALDETLEDHRNGSDDDNVLLAHGAVFDFLAREMRHEHAKSGARPVETLRKALAYCDQNLGDFVMVSYANDASTAVVPIANLLLAVVSVFRNKNKKKKIYYFILFLKCILF